MTIEQYHSNVKVFIKLASKHDYFDLALKVKNAVVELINSGNSVAVLTQQNVINARNVLNTQRNLLLQAITELKNSLLTLLGYQAYHESGFDEFLGVDFYNNLIAIENYFTEEQYEIADKVVETLRKVENLTRFYYSLESLSINLTSSHDQTGNELAIIYEDDALVNTLKDLAIISKEWNFIVNSFSRLVDENDTTIEIKSVVRGSLILTIVAAAKIITPIAAAANQIMNLVLNSLKVKQQILEIKKLNNESASKIIELLENDSKIESSKEAKKITEDLTKAYENVTPNETLKETQSFLIKSIRKMIKFQSLGGKLKPSLIEPTEDIEKITKELIEKNNQAKAYNDAISSLEEGRKILLIDEGKDEDTSSDDSLKVDNDMK